MAYYLASCRFLNPFDSKCLIHDTERQPTICKRYSPLRCWYKRVFADGISPDFIRFNATRLRLLETMVSFDAAGDLASVPSWEDMTAALGSLPLASVSGRGTGDSAADSSALRAPGAIVPAGLALPLRTPRTRSDLDLLRFRLGFHGIRISIRRGEWLTLVDSPPEAENRPAMGYAEFESFVDKCSFDEAGRILHLPDIEAETAASGTER